MFQCMFTVTDTFENGAVETGRIPSEFGVDLFGKVELESYSNKVDYQVSIVSYFN